MRLGDLLPDALCANAPDWRLREIQGLTADSRRAGPGFLFAALKGEKVDGAAYAQLAAAQGAAAILAGREAAFAADFPLPILRAGEPRRALALAAARFFPRAPARIIAVTGTNGKSSTVDYCRQIWTELGLAAASLGTLGAVGPSGVIDLGHTTPDPVAIHATLDHLAGEGVEFAAMEASSHGLDQHRLDGVKLAAVGFTNLTQDHLDYHHDMATYRAAKLRLFSELATPGAAAIVNADSPEREAFLAAAAHNKLDIVTCGWRGEALKLVELMPRKAGQRLFLRWRGQDFGVELPLIGEFQALNALCAAAFVLAVNEKDPRFSAQAAFAALEKLKGVRGRLEEVGETRDGAPVFVDYAHTPDGLATLLRAARPHAASRIVLVFGCGGDRDSAKRPKMGAIAAQLADHVIVTDDNPRSETPETIRGAIMAAAPRAHEIGDRRAAIESALAQARAGDVVLIAGKGHETGQIIGAVTFPFSDQSVARDYLLANGGRVR